MDEEAMDQGCAQTEAARYPTSYELQAAPPGKDFTLAIGENGGQQTVVTFDKADPECAANWPTVSNQAMSSDSV